VCGLVDRPGIDPEVARGLALVAAAKGRDNVFVAAVVDHAFDPARRVHNPAGFIQSRLIGGFQPPAGNGKPRTAPPTKDFSFCV